MQMWCAAVASNACLFHATFDFREVISQLSTPDPRARNWPGSRQILIYLIRGYWNAKTRCGFASLRIASLEFVMHELFVFRFIPVRCCGERRSDLPAPGQLSMMRMLVWRVTGHLSTFIMCVYDKFNKLCSNYGNNTVLNRHWLQKFFGIIIIALSAYGVCAFQNVDKIPCNFPHCSQVFRISCFRPYHNWKHTKGCFFRCCSVFVGALDWPDDGKPHTHVQHAVYISLKQYWSCRPDNGVEPARNRLWVYNGRTPNHQHNINTLAMQS